MTLDLSNGKKFSEQPLAAGVGSGDDILLIKMADGTGVKALKMSALMDYLGGSAIKSIGSLDDLTTTDKATIVAAINELVTADSKNKEAADKSIGENANAIKALSDIINAPGATAANAYPVEKDLGTEFTSEMSDDIRNGKFQIVRTGAYIRLNGHKYWMGHADYRLHCGDTELTTHHMLVFPDDNMFDAKMNASNTTAGGYYGSDMVTNQLATALATIEADFGADHILTYRNLLCNTVDANGNASNWSWYDRKLDLMSESMVYGHQAWGTVAHNGFDVGIDKTQIALFHIRPDLICNRKNWWLRDVRSAAYFACVDTAGAANALAASDSVGRRPAFLIY